MIKKYKTYKLLTLHDKILNRFDLDSTILKTKSLQIVQLYEIIKNIKNPNITDEQIVLITIYILMDRLHINLETKRKIGIGLDVSIVKKINIVLNVILTVSNISLKDTLKAGNKKTNWSKNELYNLMYDKILNQEGTTFYRSSWSMLDNIIVSYPMITTKKSYYKATWTSGKILKKDFMMKEIKNNIKIPLRTFEGKKYLNGYSDHLPVYVVLTK